MHWCVTIATPFGVLLCWSASDAVLPRALQGFAGTLFVRSEEELRYLRLHGILRVLTDVGLPWRE